MPFSFLFPAWTSAYSSEGKSPWRSSFLRGLFCELIYIRPRPGGAADDTAEGIIGKLAKNKTGMNALRTLFAAAGKDAERSGTAPQNAQEAAQPQTGKIPPPRTGCSRR